MAIPVELSFGSPCAWIRQRGIPGIEDAPEAGNSGIYLWTVETSIGELVYYVGETGRSFAARMQEHLVQQLAGMYHIYEPEPFRNGVKQALWTGGYGRTKEPSGIVGFVQSLPTMAPGLAGYVRLMRFRLAALDADKRVRERIEAALALHLKNQPDPIGSFQEDGVRYVPRRSHEAPILIACRSDGSVLGLPASLEV